MGNCLRHQQHQSSTRWAGDEWGSSASAANDGDEEKGLLVNNPEIGLNASPSAIHEVKVKISKKQLEELLGRVDAKELSVQQVLEQLINVGNQYEANQRSWRPALQSIPEGELS
ncbi:uncharacterized protein LOC105787199 [Gossypium raimondii]|uniref:Uncharacterized protein n=3 Tax=Gossypium TaxID=3633 RepID=A0A0D2NK27_GOSRA|nr:uncharacterized protein LOC105787199 [Gossypium raimondii]KJB13668.1 hypothetical protein B456_002G088300 [Gossypium raimondii]MBA0580310.1 hypothetical protein [Gossypium raimondii]MBA0823052.1 hypothetical protein [Gossypium armourianum]